MAIFFEDRESQQLLKNQVDVSLTLAKQLLLNNGKNSNLVFSPISIQVVLGLIAAGSSGPTLNQLLSFLKAKKIDDLKSLYSQLVDIVFADCSSSGGPHVSVANGVWIHDSLSLKPSFQHVVETLYEAACHRLDFQNEAEKVRNLVNSWVEKETRGLIKNILSPGSVDSEVKLILANALYFKGEWSCPFNASETKQFDFHLLDSSSIKVPFMTSMAKQFISVFDGFKVLKLPYKHGSNQILEGTPSFSMYIFLPDAKDGLYSLVEKAVSSSGFLDSHVPCKRVKVGDFRIPKFRFEYNIEVSQMLRSLGLVLPFDRAGFGLREMVYDDPLCVSRMIHKSLIEVDEQGTEAAAATVAECMVCTCSMYPKKPKVVINFVADHPFLYVIRENSTGSVQFIGHVLNPSTA